jgi:hypothetical protein
LPELAVLASYDPDSEVRRAASAADADPDVRKVARLALARLRDT